MSVRTTETDYAVALYDATTGKAFGEVFRTADEADAFLAYVREDGRDIRKLAIYAELRAQWESSEYQFGPLVTLLGRTEMENWMFMRINERNIFEYKHHDTREYLYVCSDGTEYVF